MAEHEHLYDEVTNEPLACPDGWCWWNDPEPHEGPGRFTELTVKDAPQLPDLPEAADATAWRMDHLAESRGQSHEPGLVANWYAALGLFSEGEWDPARGLYEPEAAR